MFFADAQTNNWIGGSAGNWNNAANWSNGVPTSTSDVVINTNGAAITLDFTSPASIKSLTVNDDVTLQTDATRVLNVGSSGAAVTVAASKTLTMLSSVNSVGLTIAIPTGCTATFYGNLNLGTSASTFTSQAHKITGVDAGSITFQNGSVCTASSKLSGNAFGTSGVDGIVLFKSGSKYVYAGGANPFGTSAPNAITKFETGSTFSQQANSAPALTGRTYANFEYNVNTTSAFTASAGVTFDDLTVLQGSLTLGSATTGTTSSSYVIKGNITVNSGATFNFGQGTGTGSNITNITFSGVGKSITINSGATFSQSNTGSYTTNYIIGAGANFTFNTNLNLATTNTTSTLTVQPLGTLIMAAGTTLTTNGKVTVQSDATGNGNIGNSAGTISGTVIVKRYIPGKRAFRFLAHPFTTALSLSSIKDTIDITGTGGAANGFTATTTNNPSAFYYDPTAGNSATSPDPGWTAFANTTATSWNQYQGLRILVRGTKGTGLDGNSYTPSAVTLVTNGTLNTSDQFIPLIKGTNSGFNLIGNPYAASVDVSLTTRASNISSSFWVWDATAAGSNGRGAYVSQPFSTSYILPSGAAFFATTSANSNNIIAFTESCKSTATPVSLFGNTNSIFGNNTLQLRLEQNGDFYDRIIVLFDKANSTKGTDWNDADKLVNPDANLATVNTDNKQLSIDARPYDNSLNIPLYLNISQPVIGNGKFNFTLPDFDLTSGRNLYLFDKLNNSYTLLTKGASYPFEVSTSDSATQFNRFTLTANAKVNLPIASTDNQLHVSLINNISSLQVVINANQNENTAVRLFDFNGKQLQQQVLGKISNSSSQLDISSLAHGLYVVEVTNGNEKAIIKTVKF